jgi:hypothetical protein
LLESRAANSPRAIQLTKSPKPGATGNGSKPRAGTPQIARFMEAGIDPDDPQTRDERFEFGLGCVLDGIAARLQARCG